MENGKLTMTDSTFRENTAFSVGQRTVVDSSKRIDVTYQAHVCIYCFTSFRQNGGALYMKDGSLTVRNNVFEDNTAVKVSSNAKRGKERKKCLTVALKNFRAEALFSSTA